MGGVYFWDVDTQYDFMKPDGKLYVKGAEVIEPNLYQLTLYARYHAVRILGSVDYHSMGDPEISQNPDFEKTFPPHCLKGTPGAQKIPETEPERPLWIDSERMLWKELERCLVSHPGEIYFRKNRFDVFSNSNVDYALEILKPEEVVVYGVCLDICNAYAVNGFLERGKFQVSVVEDASWPLSRERADRYLAAWRKKGVKMLRTSDVIGKTPFVS